ncbi:hypothetical protein ACWC4C_10295 [Streptomyces olivaceoviridis]
MNFEIEPRSANDLIDSLTAKIDAAQSPEDFTHEYDSAVDDLEAHLLKAALEAMSQVNIDEALRNLNEMGRVRRSYLGLLDRCAADPLHPMAPEMTDLRSYAIKMDNTRDYLQGIWEALKDYVHGRGTEALRRLDQSKFHTAIEDDSSSAFDFQLRVNVEHISGLIRRGVMDYAGARAAFDRAAAIAEDFSEALSSQREKSETDVGLIQVATFLRYVNEAYSCQMQYEQQLSVGDYVSAIEAAHASSIAFLRASDHADNTMHIISNILRASSFEALAQEDIAKANIELEQGNWASASELIKSIQNHYQTASRACLRIKHPSASVMQERFLNSGSAWVTRLRRQMDREQKYLARIEELQLELRTLYGSVCNALGPAGVVVNNATEMVTSVKQQVEVVSRIETNIRTLLREIPDAIADSEIPANEREELSSEALRLANEESDQATFFARVRKFAQGVAEALGKGVELATPVVALLKSLSIVK